MKAGIWSGMALILVGCAAASPPGPIPAAAPDNGTPTQVGTPGAGPAPVEIATATCDPSNDSCPLGTYCAAASCVPGCKADADCNPGQLCTTNHQCADGCSSTHPCANGAACIDGTCEPRTPPQDSSLIAYWPFDDGGATSTADLSGHELNAAVDGASAVAGKLGQAYAFDGTTSCISLPDVPALSPSSNALTAMAWVLPAQGSCTDHAAIFDKEQQFAGGLSCADSSMQAWVGGAWSGSYVFDREHWHHVAVTYDGSIVRSYVDGVEVSSAAAEKVGLSDFGLGIGCGNVGSDGSTAAATDRFTGIIDEVALYSRALGADEIAQYVDNTR